MVSAKLRPCRLLQLRPQPPDLEGILRGCQEVPDRVHNAAADRGLRQGWQGQDWPARHASRAGCSCGAAQGGRGTPQTCRAGSLLVRGAQGCRLSCLYALLQRSRQILLFAALSANEFFAGTWSQANVPTFCAVKNVQDAKLDQALLRLAFSSCIFMKGENQTGIHASHHIETRSKDLFTALNRLLEFSGSTGQSKQWASSHWLSRAQNWQRTRPESIALLKMAWARRCLVSERCH